MFNPNKIWIIRLIPGFPVIVLTLGVGGLLVPTGPVFCPGETTICLCVVWGCGVCGCGVFGLNVGVFGWSVGVTAGLGTGV